MLRIYDRLNQKTVIRFVDYVLEKLPFKVEVIQTDNGAEFQAQFREGQGRSVREGVSAGRWRALGRNRTCGPRFRKPLLSPLSYEGML